MKRRSRSTLQRVLENDKLREHFADFRKAGLTHSMMAEIEKELGISR